MKKEIVSFVCWLVITLLTTIGLAQAVAVFDCTYSAQVYYPSTKATVHQTGRSPDEGYPVSIQKDKSQMKHDAIMLMYRDASRAKGRGQFLSFHANCDERVLH